MSGPTITAIEAAPVAPGWLRVDARAGDASGSAVMPHRAGLPEAVATLASSLLGTPLAASLARWAKHADVAQGSEPAWRAFTGIELALADLALRSFGAAWFGGTARAARSAPPFDPALPVIGVA